MNVPEHDVVIIGAGPAGISAALMASSCGLKTLLLDEQPRPGGQIYRNITRVSRSVAELLGPDYRHGAALTTQLARSGVEVHQGALVWDVAQGFTITAQMDGRSYQVRARQLIVASGAMERPSPLPGWTLPGVMNAGAAQILLKSSGSVPAGRVVMAGGGPLLLLVACQLLEAGVTLAGIVETSSRANWWRALRHLPTALGAPAYLAKGVQMLLRLRRAGVPMFAAATGLCIEGKQAAQGLSFTHAGLAKRLDADLVLLHHGVVPNTRIGQLLRVEHHWDKVQLSLRPRVDVWGASSLAGFRIAGDSAGIAGALAAECSGALAALGAARDLGHLSESECNQRSAPIRQRLAAQLRIRPFLDALYRPPEWLSNPSDNTIVCRCEEVTAGRIREMAQLGCQGPNQTKFFSRCGMGPCQGRLCGLTVTQMLAGSLGKRPDEIGFYRVRAPLKPVRLASLAALAQPTATDEIETTETT